MTDALAHGVSPSTVGRQIDPAVRPGENASVPQPVTVVVVDDEVALVDLVRRYLTREGYEVHTAHDGERRSR